MITPERDSFTVHFPDGGFVKVRLIGSKDDIDLFKAEHEPVPLGDDQIF